MKQFGFRLFKPAYNLLGTVGGLLFLSSFFDGGRTADFHLHDTYFIIAISYLVLVPGCYFIFLWLAYGLLRKRRTVPALTTIHVMTTLAFIAVLIIPLLVYPKRYVDFSNWKFSGWLPLTMIFFLLGQLLFLINVLIVSVRKSKS